MPISRAGRNFVCVEVGASGGVQIIAAPRLTQIDFPAESDDTIRQLVLKICFQTLVNLQIQTPLMAIPVYETVKLPVLKALSDGKEHSIGELMDIAAKSLQLTQQDLEEVLASGTQTRWHNRVSWSCIDLMNAGLASRPRRGRYQITPEGQSVLKNPPFALTREFLKEKSPAFAAWMKKRGAVDNTVHNNGTSTDGTIFQTPTERLEDAFEEINARLKEDILEKICAIDPYRFEQLVLDVLVAMGYGGSRAEAARVTQRSADGGVDGFINEDRLGLDTIYMQAKRWEASVGRKELQAFVGALSERRGQKGVFITSGEFASTALEYVKNIPQKVVLINGTRLAELMIEHGVGTSEEKKYVLRRLDTDYFEGE